MRDYYIVEHPTRGTLMDLDWSAGLTQYGRFSVEGSRADAMRFYTQSEAEAARSKIVPKKLREDCQIRSSRDAGGYNGAWPVVA